MSPGRRHLGCALGLALVGFAAVGGEAPARLRLEERIALGEVHGRIDHLAIDVARRRLFVAELGNDSVAVVSLDRAAVLQRLTGFAEPQGVAWSEPLGRLYVATGGDGKLTVFEGDPLKPVAVLPLGGDADNVRLDAASHRVLTGFGRGALASVDESTLARRPDIPIGGHPEGFQVERSGARAFVNVPDSHRIVVADLGAGHVQARWPTAGLSANFPMALEESAARLYVVFRQPAVLSVFSTRDGSVVAQVPSCGDADDVFVDERRRRLYVVCGEGRVDVFDAASDRFARLGSVATVPGARTGAWSPELDRLFVAVRAATGEPAAIWALRPID